MSNASKDTVPRRRPSEAQPLLPTSIASGTRSTREMLIMTPPEAAKRKLRLSRPRNLNHSAKTPPIPVPRIPARKPMAVVVRMPNAPSLSLCAVKMPISRVARRKKFTLHPAATFACRKVASPMLIWSICGYKSPLETNVTGYGTSLATGSNGAFQADTVWRIST